MCIALGGSRMKRGIVLIGTIVAMLFLSGATSGTIWYVHPDSLINSIQAGMDFSSSGDAVLVYNTGIYYFPWYHTPNWYRPGMRFAADSLLHDYD